MGAAASNLMAQAQSEAPVRNVVRAKKFELVGPAGNVRALLATGPDVGPGLQLSDAAGNERAVVGCTTTRSKRTDAEIKHPESTLSLFNAEGDLLWQAP